MFLAGLQLGKKRKAKLKQLIQNYVQETTPSTSGQNRSNPQQTKEDIFMDADEDPLDVFVEPEIIEFSSHEKVIVLDEQPKLFKPSNCRNYDEYLINSMQYWHLVVISHQRLFEKNDILQELQNLLKDNLFAPVAYTQEREVDYFLVHGQGESLKKLFQNGLILQIKDKSLRMMVKLGVAFYQKGQLKVFDKVLAVTLERMENAELYGGTDKLNLDRFGEHPLLRDVVICLGNKYCLNLLCDHMNGITKLKEQFRIFRLADNDINTLEPFEKLFGLTISKLDLRNNKIANITQFQHLQKLQIEELYLSGNECVKIPDYAKKIRDIIPSLKKIDNIQFEAVVPPSQPKEMLVPKMELKADIHQAISSFHASQQSGNDPITEMHEGIVIKPGDVASYRDNNRLVKCYDNRMWHQVTINHNRKYTKEEILSEIIPKLFRNSTFFPCYYNRFGDRDEFFLFNNFDSIFSLVKNRLACKMPQSHEYITLILHLKCANWRQGQVDWCEKIKRALIKRVKDNILNLNNFSKDAEFEKVFVSLSSNSNLSLVLEEAKKINIYVTRINAQNNEICSKDGLLQGLTQYKRLTILDLRNNKIDELGAPKALSIRELFLDGNPICSKLGEPYLYVSHIKSMFPCLEYLDGHRIDMRYNMLQNYLIIPTGYAFVEEFMKLFFGTYDSFERNKLLSLYSPYAIFTMSMFYEQEITQMDSLNAVYARIQTYQRFSRNTSKIANMQLGYEKANCGQAMIANILNELPKTKHDFTSFCIDVPIFDSKKVILITVNGTFEELGKTLNEERLLLGFSRTFVLRADESEKFCITNDQLLIRNATIPQKNAHGKEPVKYEDLTNYCSELLPSELEDRELKMILFCECTQLKKEECARYEENLIIKPHTCML